MLKTKTDERALRVISELPKKLGEETLRILRGRRGGVSELREIRIRAEGRSSMLCGCESIALLTVVTRAEVDELVNRLCDGALYAHRDSIASGYITMSGGVRVGICGYARYEYKSFVGVSEMRSLVFRIPTGECDFAKEIYSVFSEGVHSGMLIYSPPGVGKTTALRSLAASIGGGAHPRKVCVVDERCEFSEDDYTSCEVDILKGYKRRTGIEIATRTMSPDIIMIDEIGGDDAISISGVVRCGIPLVATAHAASFDELMKKVSLAPLFECGAFDVFVGISRSGDGYSLQVDRK